MTNDILFFAEQQDGRLTKMSREIAGGAWRLAKKLHGGVTAVLIGPDSGSEAGLLLKSGANRVLFAEYPELEYYSTARYAQIMDFACEKIRPSLVLLGSTTVGMDLAPALAVRTGAGLVTDCTGLWLAEEDGGPVSARFRMSRPNVNAVTVDTLFVPEGEMAMATLRPGVLAPLTKEEAALLPAPKEISMEQLFLPEGLEEDPIALLSVERLAAKAEDITSARILAAGGRGMGGPEGFDALRRIAELLGGTIACSRACVEAGWVDTAFQVGQTGKTVRPDLYLACGISGAFQHVTGMEGSKLIISINKNPAAPIFDISDLGIVASVEVLLPQLILALEEYRNS